MARVGSGRSQKERGSRNRTVITVPLLLALSSLIILAMVSSLPLVRAQNVTEITTSNGSTVCPQIGGLWTPLKTNPTCNLQGSPGKPNVIAQGTTVIVDEGVVLTWGNLQNDGNITSLGGLLNPDDGVLVSTGSVWVKGGGLVNDINGQLNSTGSIRISAGGNMTNNGGSIRNLGAGTITVYGQVINAQGLLLNLGNITDLATITNGIDGNMTNVGLLNDRGYVINSFIVKNVKTLAITAAGNFTSLSNTRVYNLGGTVSNAGVFTAKASTLVLNSGIVNNAMSMALGTMSTFQNNGTLTNTGNLVNSGTILNGLPVGNLTNAKSGVLSGNGSISQTSAGTTTNKGTMNFTSPGGITVTNSFVKQVATPYPAFQNLLGTITLNNGTSLVTGQNGSVENDAVMNVAAGAKLTVTTGTLIGSYPFRNTVSGTVNNAGTMNLEDGLLNLGTISNTGTIVNSAQRTGLYFNNSGFINNYKLFVNQGPMINNKRNANVVVPFPISNATLGVESNGAEFYNRGTFNNTAGSTGGGFNNQGYFKNGGAANNQGSFNNTGYFDNLPSPSTTTTRGILQLGGFVNGGTLTNSLSFSNYGPMNNSGTFNNTRMGTFYNKGTVRNTGGIVNGKYAILINRGTIINSGYIKNYGSKGFRAVGAGGVLQNVNGGTISNGGGAIYNYGAFSNNGTVTIDATGLISNYGSITGNGTIENSGEFTNACAGSVLATELEGSKPSSIMCSVPTIETQPGTVFDTTTPTISGSSDPDANIILEEGGTVVGSSTAGAYGNWTVTASAQLQPGSNTLTVWASGVDGNASAAASVGIVISQNATATTSSSSTLESSSSSTTTSSPTSSSSTSTTTTLSSSSTLQTESSSTSASASSGQSSYPGSFAYLLAGVTATILIARLALRREHPREAVGRSGV